MGWFPLRIRGVGRKVDFLISRNLSIAPIGLVWRRKTKKKKKKRGETGTKSEVTAALLSLVVSFLTLPTHPAKLAWNCCFRLSTKGNWHTWRYERQGVKGHIRARCAMLTFSREARECPRKRMLKMSLRCEWRKDSNEILTYWSWLHHEPQLPSRNPRKDLPSSQTSAISPNQTRN